MNNNILAPIQEHLISKIQSATDVNELIQIWILWDNLLCPKQIKEPTLPQRPKNITLEDLKKVQNQLLELMERLTPTVQENS
jgi:hypothetical protein